MENNKTRKKVIISFTVALVVSFVLAGLVFWIWKPDYEKALEGMGINTGLTVKDTYSMLSTAFFVPGVMFAGYGLLLLIAIQGNFIGFQFMMKQVGQFFIMPFVRNVKRFKYAEFKLEKEAEEAEKSKAPTRWNALIVGIIDLLISSIFLVLYYKV